MLDKDVEKFRGNFKAKIRSFGGKASDTFVKVGSKLGGNKVLSSIRDAFAVASIPILGAAFPLIVGMIFFQNGVLLGKIPGIQDSAFIMWTDKYIAQWFWSIWSVATAPFTLYFVICIGYFMSRAFLTNGAPLTGAIVTVACYFCLKPLGINFDEQPKYLGTDAVLVGVFVGLLAPYVFAKLMAIKKMRIKLPESVPPVISEVFASVISIAVVLLVFSFIGKGWEWIATAEKIGPMVDGKVQVQDTVFKIIEYVLAKPFATAGINIGTTAIIAFFIAFFWFFGLHGSNILSAITSILWTPLMLDNAEYWKLYLADPKNTGIGISGNYWTLPETVGGNVQDGLYPLVNANMGYIGGTGATLGLIIVILIFSRYRAYREVSKLALGPGIFGINEPITFGVPIIYNISFFVPYVIGFTCIFTLGHAWILLHWVRPVVVPLGWTPFILQNLMMSGFDWRTVPFDLLHLILACLMWWPFLLLGEKVQKTLDAADNDMSYADYNKLCLEEYKQIKIDRKNKRLSKKNSAGEA